LQSELTVFYLFRTVTYSPIGGFENNTTPQSNSMTNAAIFAVTMPKWGIEMQQGTIAQWHANPGQYLKRGDPMFDVETDKIVNQVEAPIAGTLRKIVAATGSTESVGALIALIADASVAESDIEAFAATFNPAADAAGATEAAVKPAAAASTAAAPADGEAKVSPIARRVAERLGVDLSQVKGTGRNGRISQEDVEAFAAARQGGNTSSPATAPSSSPPAPAVPANVPVREPLTSMRATIARRLLESTQGIPHYRLASDVSMDALLARRAELTAGGAAVSINDLLVRACALALREHPALNAQFDGSELLKFPHADISVAVATDAGLVTPIVRLADTLSAAEIGRVTARLSASAREGRLTREDITGGTFTISNLGMFGVDRFDAIINPPQVAILAVGSIGERLVLRDGRAAAAKFASLTLSCDHRVVDGAIGARFLARLRELIENPGPL
jgi:pyruvate dehydrogenase E2 component (dihydrolipoamide acetyltransferase)